MSAIAKPIIPVLDTTNSIQSGLLFDLPLFEGVGTQSIDLVSGGAKLFSNTPVWQQTTPWGWTLNFTHASSQFITVSSAKILAGLTNMSLLIIYNANQSSAFAQDEDLYCERGSSGNDLFKVENRSAEGVIWFRVRDDAATLFTLAGTKNPNDSKPHSILVTKSGTSLIMYFDGIQDTTGSSTATDTLTDATLNSLVGTDQADSTKAIDGNIIVARGWNRTLSATEALLLYQNPFRIYLQPSVNNRGLRPRAFSPGLGR